MHGRYSLVRILLAVLFFMVPPPCPMSPLHTKVPSSLSGARSLHIPLEAPPQTLIIGWGFPRSLTMFVHWPPHIFDPLKPLLISTGLQHSFHMLQYNPLNRQRLISMKYIRVIYCIWISRLCYSLCRNDEVCWKQSFVVSVFLRCGSAYKRHSVFIIMCCVWSSYTEMSTAERLIARKH